MLTEGDYFDLARNANHPSNQRLRLLLKNLAKDSAVYLVIKQRDPLIDSYTQEYWSERKLHLVFVEEYEELPGLWDTSNGVPHRRENCPDG